MADDNNRPASPPWLNIRGSKNAPQPRAHTTRRVAAASAAKAKAPARRRVAGTRNGTTPPLELAGNARVVLERRYLAKDADGNLTETPEELFRRVARTIAAIEANYGDAATAQARVADAEARFYALMATMRFLPNSPTLGNAGRPLQQLSACFVLPVEDSMLGIFDSLKNTALIHQSGGGTGFAFSRLRPAGDRVASTGGVASGPVSFMRVFDAATESIKQGGTRRGANMAILSIDHPDIETFINVKSDMTTLQNFNISVAVTERFMQAVERDETYDLVNPRTKEKAGERRARDVFRQLIENAWRNGDPGVVFLDRINHDNPTPQLGMIEATNPCGEQPLLPYESCNLGSLNLAAFVREAAPPPTRTRRNGTPPPPAELDWDALAEAIPQCVRFLDDVIDANRYPIPEIDEMTKRTRKVGLGVMGWADLLFRLRLPYDSDEAITLAGRVMSFVQEHANRASVALAEERGVFPAWHGSIYDPAFGDERGGPRYRNATRTTVAPTGTLSIIADCSGGIEPAFALAFMRQHFLDRDDPSKPTRLPEVNGAFRAVAQESGFYSEDLMTHLAEGGALADRDEVPEWAKRVFVTSHDVAPEWHVRMQAAFQRHTDNAVSKTINFRGEATVADVEQAYRLAYREGCKGITVYRDGSRDHQVLSHATTRGPEQAESIAAEIALGFADVFPPGAAHPQPLSSTAPRPSGTPYRRHLPDERRSITHKFRVGEQEGYVTVGLYDEGQPGEIFVNISKEGSTIRGLMDSVAVLTSVALQYGVPLANLVAKFRGVHFEPAGLTGNAHIPVASSLVDYIFRWLELRFLGDDGAAASPAALPAPAKSARTRKPAGKPAKASAPAKPRRSAKRAATAPVATPPDRAADARPARRTSIPPQYAAAGMSTGLGCPECGAILYFAEGCLTCRSCGYTKCG